jgi:CRP-like cAMP-binding protein
MGQSRNPDSSAYAAYHSNHLLRELDPPDLEALVADFELVALPVGTMLYEPGAPLRHAWFPKSAVISLHYVLESGASAESAGVGPEGMVGVPLFTGGETTTNSAVVHLAGEAWRLPGTRLKAEFRRAGSLHRVLLRYTQNLIAQMAQTGICNRHHSVLQQIARWLLLTLDRVPEREIIVTQELIAGLLGVRRESVTDAAGRLQEAGAIRYRRGHLSVIDRDRLLHLVCECYPPATASAAWLSVRGTTAADPIPSSRPHSTRSTGPRASPGRAP